MPYRLSDNGKCVEIEKGGAWRTLKCYSQRADALDYLIALNANVGMEHQRKIPTRYSHIDFKPTQQMADNAKQALAWRREFNRGGEPTGVSRARDISNMRNLSPQTVKRMFSFFSRHEVDKQAEGFNRGERGFPSAGRIAWDLWGGDAGFAWARKRWGQMQSADTKTIKARLSQSANYFTHSAFKALGDGKWLAIFTNDFEDLDREILKSSAHDAYVERVKAGIVPLPELWIWHKAGSRLGEALHVDRVGHMTFAIGKFDDTPAGREAEKADYSDVKLSHGFSYPSWALKDKVYHEFDTFEISLLPKGAEANPFTTFEAIKESNIMPVNKAQLEFIKKLVGDDNADAVVAQINTADKSADVLEKLGMRFKALATEQKEGEAKADTTESKADNMQAKATPEEIAMVVAELVEDNSEYQMKLEQLMEMVAVTADIAEAEMKKRKSLETRIEALEKALNEAPSSVKAQKSAEDTNQRFAQAREAIQAKSKGASLNDFETVFSDLYQE